MWDPATVMLVREVGARERLAGDWRWSESNRSANRVVTALAIRVTRVEGVRRARRLGRRRTGRRRERTLNYGLLR